MQRLRSEQRGLEQQLQDVEAAKSKEISEKQKIIDSLQTDFKTREQLQADVERLKRADQLYQRSIATVAQLKEEIARLKEDCDDRVEQLQNETAERMAAVGEADAKRNAELEAVVKGLKEEKERLKEKLAEYEEEGDCDEQIAQLQREKKELSDRIAELEDLDVRFRLQAVEAARPEWIGPYNSWFGGASNQWKQFQLLARHIREKAMGKVPSASALSTLSMAVLLAMAAYYLRNDASAREYAARLFKRPFDALVTYILRAAGFQPAEEAFTRPPTDEEIADAQQYFRRAYDPSLGSPGTIDAQQSVLRTMVEKAAKMVFVPDEVQEMQDAFLPSEGAAMDEDLPDLAHFPAYAVRRGLVGQRAPLEAAVSKLLDADACDEPPPAARAPGRRQKSGALPLTPPLAGGDSRGL